MKIRTKFFAMFLVALVPLFVALTILAQIAQVSDREKTADLMAKYVQTVSLGIDAFFNSARNVATTMAFLHGGTMMSWEDGGGVFFQGIIDLFPDVNRMSLVDENGYFYQTGSAGNPWQGGRLTENDLDPNARPITLSDREYFRELVAQNTRAEPLVMVNEPLVTRGAGGEKYIITSVAVIHEGRAAGVINAMQSSRELKAVYDGLVEDFAQMFGTRANMYLASRGGQLVSQLEYNEQAGAYQDLLLGSDEIVSLDMIGADMISAIGRVEHSTGSNAGVVDAKIGGRDFFVLGAAIEGTPFAAFIAVPQRDMLSASRAIRLASWVLFLAIGALLSAGMLLILRPILASLNGMDGTMKDIVKERDLTARVDAKGNDEIAAIGESVNSFVGSINTMIADVSVSAGAMEVSAQTLSDNASSISGGVSSIARDIGDLNFTAEEQSASVTETSATITQIAQNIESLTRQIEDQSSAVTQSSTAVQQMIANINSISENVSKSASSFGELKQSAAGGRESISAVQELVNNLSSQSDSLLEANGVIDDIASQTNLLAMNAAIEAAHAGEAGKGFAVVAEEIRKLAEDSASQSKTIAAGLKSTIAAINNIAQATTTADSAFDNVASKINALVAHAEYVNLALHEQSEGSHQVLEALQEIENVTANIRNGAVEMNSGTETILKEINRLSNVSHSVRDRSQSIAKAAETISVAVDEIVRNTGSNKEAIDVLVGVTGKFRL